MSEAQLCTFRVGDLLLGLPLEDVQEVLDDSRPVVRVPLAPPAVRGLINLRSQVVLSLDLRRLLEDEVPEIYQGLVEIRSISREPGQRSDV